MKKTVFLTILLVICLGLLCFSLVACDKEKNDPQAEPSTESDQAPVEETANPEKSAYELYKEKFGFEGTEEEWVEALLNGNLFPAVGHTITFDPQNGDETFTQAVVHGEKAVEPEAPTRLGYTFRGWILESSTCGPHSCGTSRRRGMTSLIHCAQPNLRFI